MTDPVEPLILDLLEWLGPGPRPYAEVIEAWRTSALVELSALGKAHFRAHRLQRTAAQPSRWLSSARG